MLLLPPPRCDLLFSRGPARQSSTAARRFSFPLWPATHTGPTPHPTSSPQPSTTQTDPSQIRQLNSAPTATHEMSSIPGIPRSLFSPTLGSIPEVFEHESLNASNSPLATPAESQDVVEAFIPEASCVTPASLTRANSSDAIIQSPRKAKSVTAVCKLLRGVLEADRIRRRRILKVYLKAIVFLKYLWRANERYGNVMVTTGMYMQR